MSRGLLVDGGARLGPGQPSDVRSIPAMGKAAAPSGGNMSSLSMTDQAIQLLAGEVDELGGVVQGLESRLGAVLGPARPSEAQGAYPDNPIPLVSVLMTLHQRIRAAKFTLTDIIDRLGV